VTIGGGRGYTGDMPQESKKEGDATEQPSLQGLVASREDETALLDALEKAFDYRGDVTVELTSGERVFGYIFDRRRRDTLAESTLRMLPEGSDEQRTIAFDQISRLEFTGKDTAHGKSFEKWIERYVEKKRTGEEASIHSDPLE